MTTPALSSWNVAGVFLTGLDLGKMPTFRLGDMVRVKSGPFAAITGRIEGINQARLLLKINVNIFGLPQPIKIGFFDVDKLEFNQLSSTKED